MPNKDKLIERVILDAVSYSDDAQRLSALQFISNRAYRIASSILAAVEQAGLVIVPVEPTEEMLQAACDATFGPEPQTPAEYHGLGYRAMISTLTDRRREK